MAIPANELDDGRRTCHREQFRHRATSALASMSLVGFAIAHGSYSVLALRAESVAGERDGDGETAVPSSATDAIEIAGDDAHADTPCTMWENR